MGRGGGGWRWKEGCHRGGKEGRSRGCHTTGWTITQSVAGPSHSQWPDHHTVSGQTITQSVAGPSHSLGVLREAHHEVEERVGMRSGGGLEMEGGLSPRRGGGEEQELSHRVEAEADHHTLARPPHSRDGRTTQ